MAPILDDHKALGVVLIFRDLSERRALQRRFEHADRLAALGTLAAGVAHEINNPLAVIMANLALITQALSKYEPALRSTVRRSIRSRRSSIRFRVMRETSSRSSVSRTSC